MQVEKRSARNCFKSKQKTMQIALCSASGAHVPIDFNQFLSQCSSEMKFSCKAHIMLNPYPPNVDPLSWPITIKTVVEKVLIQCCQPHTVFIAHTMPILRSKSRKALTKISPLLPVRADHCFSDIIALSLWKHPFLLWTVSITFVYSQQLSFEIPRPT